MVNGASIKAIIGIAAALLVAALVGFAGSRGTALLSGWPLYSLCVALAFVIQWLMFVPAYAKQTERFFDLTGSLTFIGVAALALSLGPQDGRAVLVALLVTVWAVRLGSFLFLRIRRDGSDRRFDHIKPDFFLFLMTWTLQGLWVALSLAAGLVALTTNEPAPIGPVAIFGALLWIAGFLIEVVADRQKSVFRADPANAQKFIRTGLWARSRHPNYLGEIMLWCGIAIIALPVLRGWQFATLISPVFITLLLTKVSGVRMLEARAKKKWGDDPAYQDYVASTPTLVPGIGKRNAAGT